MSKHQIWSFFLLPILLNVLLFGLLVYAVVVFSASFYQLMITNAANLGLSEGTWLFVLLTWFFSYGVKLLLFYVVWQFYQLLSLIFLAPLFSYLSEKVQAALSSHMYPFSASQFFKDLGRGLQIAMVNIFYQGLWLFGLYAGTFFIPVLLPFLPPALFLVGAYYYGFAMIDYRNEVYRLSPAASRKTVKLFKWFALGNGVAFQLLLMIPVVGTLFAPSFALVAAALGLEELVECSNLNPLPSLRV